MGVVNKKLETKKRIKKNRQHKPTYRTTYHSDDEAPFSPGGLMVHRRPTHPNVVRDRNSLRLRVRELRLVLVE